MTADTYEYRAARPDGKLVRGLVRAPSLTEATTRVLELGLSPVRLDRAIAPTNRRTAPRRDLAIAFRSIASLVVAGLPLERALAATEPLCRGGLRAALASARRELLEGASLATTLDQNEGVFPPVAVAMIRAGERASRLTDSLEQVASQLEHEAELVARVRGALAYPAVLAVGGTVSVGVIATVVIPRFAVLLEDLGQALPPSTALLLHTSDFLTHWWLPLLLAGVVALTAAATWIRTPSGLLRWHSFLLSLPVIGTLRLALGSVRSLRAMAGALASGMPLVPALTLARDAPADAALAARFDRAKDMVSEGRTLTASLSEVNALAPLALQLVAIGESSGALSSMMDRAGDVLAQDAERQLSAAVRLLEPVLIVVFGGLVAFVASALLQAVYSLRPIAT